jgi:two-component system OmpR family response regulator
MRVLLIEDDKRLATLIRKVLESEHFDVDVAHDGDTGVEIALRGAHDVVILDWMLPGRDGPAICQAIRSARLSTSVLMLTARTQVEDRVSGLYAGADDYLGKPFAFDELVARVHVLGRRYNDRTVEYLMRHPGQTLSRQQFLDYVWSYESEVQPSMVDVYISYLRGKLKQPDKKDPIRTRRGFGYSLEIENA